VHKVSKLNDARPADQWIEEAKQASSASSSTPLAPFHNTDAKLAVDPTGGRWFKVNPMQS
jgi:hypothetical protein